MSKPNIIYPKSPGEVIGGLETARQKRPNLSDIIDMHCALLQAQEEAAPVSLAPVPTAAEAEQALRQSVPLLRLIPLAFDWRAVSRLAANICRIVAQHRPDLAESLTKISHTLNRQNGQTGQLVTRHLNGEQLNLDDEGQSLEATLPAFILTHTLRPFLQATIQSCQTQVKDPTILDLWHNPTCPMCGAPPDFAALVSTKSGDSQGRRLLCAHCDTEWGYQRHGCPFCGQREQWSYFPDKHEVFRLYVCDACHCYLKTVDWRETFAHRCLPTARVITVDMDLAAAQAGYGSC